MKIENANGFVRGWGPLTGFAFAIAVSLLAPNPAQASSCDADIQKCQQEQEAARTACLSSSNPGSAGTQVAAAPQSGTGNASNQCNTANNNFGNQAAGLDGYANFCDAQRTKCSEACSRAQQSCQQAAGRQPPMPPDASQKANQAQQAKQFCEGALGDKSKQVREAANNARQNAGTSAECRGGQSAAQQPNNSPQNPNQQGGGGGGGMPMPMPMPQNQQDKDKGKHERQDVQDLNPKTEPTPLNGYMPATSPAPSTSYPMPDGSGEVQVTGSGGGGGAGDGLATGLSRQPGSVSSDGSAAKAASVSSFTANASGSGGSDGGAMAGGSSSGGFNFSLPQLQNAKGRFEDRNTSGMAIRAEDGITSSNGPSLFEKVTGQYQTQLRRGGFLETGEGPLTGPGAGSSRPEAAPPAPYSSGAGSAD
jgi:hypothetical protein